MVGRILDFKTEIITPRKVTCQNGGLNLGSPIDIHASDVDFALLDKIRFVNYKESGTVNITNTGHSIMIDGFESWHKKQPYVEKGGFRYRYRLAELHFHWAQNDSGSEHAIGGLRYPGEIHLVHYRHNLKASEAAKTPGGIAVLGVFLIVEKESKPTPEVSL
ncbi:unnamed protein product, partial [Strongylus vulgaris]